jgi:hypothetical protein
MLMDTWAIPPDLAATWWQALAGARWSRAVSWRQQVQLYRSRRLFLCQVSGPQVVVPMLEDLHHEGRLSRRQATQIEEHILSWVSATGTWRD